MASSQVEIPSSAPFGCVLKDHNRPDRYRESNARAAFQKNLKNLVRDHLHNCISISSDSNHDENSCNQINKIDSWVHNEQGNNLRNLRFVSNNHNNNNRDEESSSLSPRQSRIFDRWAARQAQDMVSSIEKQNHEAELLGNSSRASNLRSENSSVQPESSAEVTNLGASSLVQIWEARFNRSNSMNLNASRTSSGLSNVENASSEMDDSADERTIENERYDGRLNNEDSFPDWESDRTAPSDQHSLSQCGNSDGGESERVRVADIIRRLTSDHDHEHANANESPGRVREWSPGLDQAENRGFPPVVVSSPRIRGRQAFADLLMQLERDRHRELDNLVERRAVSRFSQRGRIQSLLRLRFLQRGMAVQDQQRQQSPASEVNRVPQGSSIMHLRERFSAGVEQGVTARTDAANPRSPREERANSTLHPDNSSFPSRLREENCHQEVNTNEEHSKPPVQRSTPRTTEEFLQEASPSTDAMWQGTSLGASNIDSQETADTAAACPTSDVIWRGTSLEAISLYSHETAATTMSLNDWDDNEMEEEQEASDQQFIETNYDWFTDISRPRSYWESLRREWYQEMLNNNSNNEIRQLLERGTVSTFLSSDFRETMDQLMTSRLQRQTHQEEEEQHELGNRERMEQLMSFLHRHTHPVGSQVEEEQEQEENEVEEVDGEEDGVEEEEQEEEEQHEVSNRERMYQLMSFLQRRTHPVGSQVEEEEEQEELNEVEEVDGEEGGSQEEEEEEQEQEDEGEAGSLNGHRYHEASNYFDQSTSSHMPSPSILRSWNYQDHEVGDDLDQAASTSSHLPPPSHCHDTRQFFSSTNRPSIEMEIICDLRGQMERLYHEMASLRKSIKSMDMQLKLQNSTKQEVHSVRGEGQKSHDRAPRKGSCCICYEMQVDSLLYRCGHMCTCIKCAYELQWSSGKCPICRAPIEDVVRAYADS